MYTYIIMHLHFQTLLLIDMHVARNHMVAATIVTFNNELKEVRYCHQR